MAHARWGAGQDDHAGQQRGRAAEQMMSRTMWIMPGVLCLYTTSPFSSASSSIRCGSPTSAAASMLPSGMKVSNDFLF